mmetsp:Transcript_15995/g.51023  ORF Transcript_15995/g.51023 Transcript_15995/m.51023 type:complete len:273 (-) Transcript_15995:1550-2368(-)
MARWSCHRALPNPSARRNQFTAWATRTWIAGSVAAHVRRRGVQGVNRRAAKLDAKTSSAFRLKPLVLGPNIARQQHAHELGAFPVLSQTAAAHGRLPGSKKTRSLLISDCPTASTHMQTANSAGAVTLLQEQLAQHLEALNALLLLLPRHGLRNRLPALVLVHACRVLLESGLKCALLLRRPLVAAFRRGGRLLSRVHLLVELLLVHFKRGLARTQLLLLLGVRGHLLGLRDAILGRPRLGKVWQGIHKVGDHHPAVPRTRRELADTFGQKA